MESMNILFKEAIKSKNSEKINNFLIELSKDPKKEYLTFLSYFIDNVNLPLFEKTRLNLIFVLGEIGEKIQMDEKYLKFLEEIYYKSDRWVRNEIIQAIDKISRKSELPEHYLQLIRFSLTDDYEPVVINSLNVLLGLKNLPNHILKNVIQILKSKNSEIIQKCSLILQRFVHDSNQLFYLLNDSNMYRSIKKNTIRTLLLAYFKSVINLEPLKNKIETANWDRDSKEIYIKEIETFERILLKNL
ncbi:MAG: hypothetical protein ACFE8L_05235 [Candidatus Hodarchaeota archaeon]